MKVWITRDTLTRIYALEDAEIEEIDGRYYVAEDPDGNRLAELGKFAFRTESAAKAALKRRALAERAALKLQLATLDMLIADMEHEDP